MWHRRKTESVTQGEQSLRQANADVTVQAVKHTQEEPLREVLRRIRDRNHLAEKFGEVLSQHQPGG